MSRALAWVLLLTPFVDVGAMRDVRAQRSASDTRGADVIFVPGFMASPLSVTIEDGDTAGPQATARAAGEPVSLLEACKSLFPKGNHFRIFMPSLRTVTSKQALCFFELLRLDPNRTFGDPCGDIRGLRVEAVGFGGQSMALSPESSSWFEPDPYYTFTRALEGQGYRVRYATYDWRKFGQDCFMRDFSPKITALTTESYRTTEQKVVLACHSTGCAVAWQWLSRMQEPWRKRFISHFFLITPELFGSKANVATFISGQSRLPEILPGFSISRELLNSFPGFMATFPVSNRHEIIVQTPWKKYTFQDFEDGTLFRDVEGSEDQAVQDPEPTIRVAELHVPAAITAADDVGRVHAIAGATFQFGGPTPAELINGEAPKSRLKQQASVVFTELGCVCKGPCRRHDDDGTNGWVDEWATETFRRVAHRPVSRPTCYTYGDCGWLPKKSPRSRKYGIFADHCGPEFGPTRSGPNFDFYPYVDIAGVATEPLTISLEELKNWCAGDVQCIGFTTEGSMRRITSEDGAGEFQIAEHLHEMWTTPMSSRPLTLDPMAAHFEYHTPGLFVKRADAACREFDNHQSSKNVAESRDECMTECARIDGGTMPVCYLDGGMPIKCRLALDTGMGFGYHVGKTLPLGRVLTLRAPVRPDFRQDFDKRHLAEPAMVVYDRLQLDCGKNPMCFGFTTEGALFYAPTAESAINVDSPTQGVYKKLPAVEFCQGRMRQAKFGTSPVCAAGRTYRSRLEFESEKCYLEAMGQTVPGPLRQGPCPRRHRSKLHDFSREWSKNMSMIDPVKVPTSFMWLEDVPTDNMWYFKDWFSPPQVIERVPGDGKVPAASVEGPCRHLQRLGQNANGQRKFMCYKFNSGPQVNHMSIFGYQPFIDFFLELLAVPLTS